jgi:hypothetical protein
MKEIPLSQNGKNRGRYVALVDDRDFEELRGYYWHVQRVYHSRRCLLYASRSVKQSDGKQGCILMHRDIMKAPKEFDVDHADGNGLNNQRSNLRVCTRSQNLANQQLAKHNKSGTKGVCWSKENNKWIAQLQLHGKRIYLGRFFDKNEAIKAHKEGMRRYFGEFARTE